MFDSGHKFLQNLALAALALSGFTVETRAEDKPQPVIEFLHVWRAPGEVDALRVYRDAMQERGVQWYDEAVTGNLMALQLEIYKKIAQGVPPSVTQWIGGETLGSLIKSDVFRKIPVTSTDLVSKMRPEVLEVVAEGENLLALPIGIHIQNYATYNQGVLDRFGLEVPETWDQLISYGPRLREEGIDLIVWGDDPFQRRQVFIAILASVLTPDQFDRVQDAKEPVHDLETSMARAIEIYLGLSEFNSQISAKKYWFNMSDIVASGGALGQILGDFQVPVIARQTEIACGLAPESSYQIWGFDSVGFINVDDEALRLGQAAFLDLLLDEQFNRDYVMQKGGLPVLIDVRPEELGPCHAESLRIWNAADTRMSTGDDAWRKRLGVLGEFSGDLGELKRNGPEKSAKTLIDLFSKL